MQAIRDFYVAPGVVVTGDVVLSAGVNLWFGCVVRGDLARITLGPRVNVQDGCILHTDRDQPMDVEEGVVIGHRAVLHGRSIGRDSLIGIGRDLAVRLRNRRRVPDRGRDARHREAAHSAALRRHGRPGPRCPRSHGRRPTAHARHLGALSGTGPALRPRRLSAAVGPTAVGLAEFVRSPSSRMVFLTGRLNPPSRGPGLQRTRPSCQRKLFTSVYGYQRFSIANRVRPSRRR